MNAISVVAVLVLWVASGFMALAETAFVRVSRIRLLALAAFDVAPGVTKAQVITLLQTWQRAIAALCAGRRNHASAHQPRRSSGVSGQRR